MKETFFKRLTNWISTFCMWARGFQNFWIACCMMFKKNSYSFRETFLLMPRFLSTKYGFSYALRLNFKSKYGGWHHQSDELVDKISIFVFHICKTIFQLHYCLVTIHVSGLLHAHIYVVQYALYMLIYVVLYMVHLFTQ